MATMLWDLSLVMTGGGRTANELFSNEMFFHLDAELGDPRLRLIIDSVGDAFKPILIRQVRVVRGIIRPRPEREYTKRARGYFTKKGLTGSGGHGPTDSIKLPAPFTYCATFEKDALIGDAGLMKVRGTYFDDETITSPDLNITTANGYNGAHLAGFGPVLLKAFTDHDATMALKAPEDADWLEEWRPVNSITYTGLSQHQLYNKTKTVKQKEDSFFVALVKQAIKEIRAILKVFASTVPANAVQQILGILGRLVSQFGIQKVLGAAWPKDVKPYLPQLPA